MEYINMTKSISNLTNYELDNIIKNGHIGEDTKKISELWQFYCYIEEEKKRRDLKVKELQKIMPIDKYFRTVTNKGTYLFKIIDCKESPEEMHITHYCAIHGLKIENNELIIIDTSQMHNYGLDSSVEFGWNAKAQEMIFWIIDDLAPYEVMEQTEEQYNNFIKSFEMLGFELEENF